MTTIHAWFSSASALRFGSSVYRKPDGSEVNVTRMNPERDGKHRGDRDGEMYVGEVIRTEDGGCVRGRTRVDGISSELMRRMSESGSPVPAILPVPLVTF
jgi:hypothetical protein